MHCTCSHGKETASRLLSQLPQLLQMRPATLDIKTAALADALPDKSLEAAKRMVAAEPRLLTHSVEKLQQRVKGLAEILELGPEELQTVLRQEPSLLHKATGTLGGGWMAVAVARRLSGGHRGAQCVGCFAWGAFSVQQQGQCE